jgi:dCMP deaminase
MDKHEFIPYQGGRQPNSCVKCGYPPSHEIHDMRGSEKATTAGTYMEAHIIEPVPNERIGRHEMFLEIATTLRKQSTCNRGKVGCVIVQDRRIVSTGYNGSPSGAPHCLDIGCEPHINEHVEGCVRTVHAEANCIAWAAKWGQATSGGIMYSTHSPCHECAKLIVMAGIVEFYYLTDYRAERLDVLADAGCYTQKMEL